MWLNIGLYPLVMSKIAIENGPVEIVNLPMDSMVIFHSHVTVYQRVNPMNEYYFVKDFP